LYFLDIRLLFMKNSIASEQLQIFLKNHLQS
jgi:hypothetical protein